jgi:hypothetical protein
MIKSVDSPHYHVWTDALYARQLAKSASNDWDRGSHVRWCVSSAWTAFELSAEDALDTSGLGYRFRENFDVACDAKDISRVDWGQGLWQQVQVIHAGRIQYLHGNIVQADLFPELSVADNAVATLRESVLAVYALANKGRPTWVDDDTVPPALPDALTVGGVGGSVAHITRVDNVAVDDPARIRTTYVYLGQEYEASVDPPETDPQARMNDLLNGVVVPISYVRSYRGDTIIDEWQIKMRGGPRP